MTSYRIKQNQNKGEFHSKTKSVVCPNAFCNKLCLKSHTHLHTILVTQKFNQSYALVMIRQNLPTFFSLTRLVTRLRTEKQVGNIKILPAEKATFGLLKHLAFAMKKCKCAVQEKDTGNWLTLPQTLHHLPFQSF